ncbi:MAG TPA: hypothetical protein VGA69_10500 [Nitriliruptorales bacterium]
MQRGALVAVERGVYRARGGVLEPAGAALAAVLRCRPRARLTGPRVLSLLGVDGLASDAPFEVLVQPGRTVTNVDFPVRVDPDPDRRGATFGRSLPIVRPVDAVIDTARFVGTLGERTVRAVYDSARWRKLVEQAELADRCARLGPADAGAAFFLELAAAGALIPESEPERQIGELLSVFDPALEPQVWVLPDVRVDWYWRVFRLAFEHQGGLDHATASARLRDSERCQRLDAIGVQIVPIVAADLRTPDAFTSWACAVATVRAHELGVAPPRLRTATR